MSAWVQPPERARLAAKVGSRVRCVDRDEGIRECEHCYGTGVAAVSNGGWARDAFIDCICADGREGGDDNG